MNTSKNTRISQDEFAEVTAQGVKRAMAVREKVGVELNSGEIEQISGAANFSVGSLGSGGLSFDKYIVWGGIWGSDFGSLNPFGGNSFG